MKFFKETITIVLLIALLLFLKANTLELFKIPTGSMEPTLYGALDMGKGFGDHILVLRCAFSMTSKVKIPFTEWHLPLPKKTWKFDWMKSPQVGDVIVFESPRNRNIDYIKRCSGIPGDRVRITNHQLFINDELITNTYATANYVKYINWGFLSEQLEKVILKCLNDDKDNALKKAITVNGVPLMEVMKNYKLGNAFVNINGKDINVASDSVQIELTVPPNHYFMLGDNSANSSDSRDWGFVPESYIKGKAWAIYLPFKRIRTIE